MSPAHARRALVVEAAPDARATLETRLRAEGYEVHSASRAGGARRILASTPPPSLAIVARALPDGDGMALVAELEGRCLVILVDDGAPGGDVSEAVRHGAVDVLTRPIAEESLTLSLARAAHLLDERAEKRELRAELMKRGTWQGMIGKSRAMLAVFEQVGRAASTRLPILLVGESGTGKELLARAVHAVSPRRSGPFVALNCGAIPAQLAESALFGHDKGAFTGATRAQEGAFQRASGGTLFLDEVAEMPPDLQVVFLRALEQGAVRRVGGTQETPVDVRIVAATNRDPSEAVAAGRLREDLYFRLHVLTVRMPALRDRPEDIPLLASHFVEEMARRARGDDAHDPLATTDVPSLSPAALEALGAYPWPGNVRELRNAIARAWVNHEGDRIGPRDFELPSVHERARDIAGTSTVDGMIGVPLDATLQEAERIVVETQLARHDGHRGRTAKALGIAPKTLYNKCKRWGLS